MRDLPATVPALGTYSCDLEVIGHAPGDHQYDFCLYSDANGLVKHPVVAKARIVASPIAKPKPN